MSLPVFATTASQQLLDRARTVIPNGVYGHYGSAMTDTAPIFFDHARGAHFTDVDGNTYIDWMCAHGPMILGYNHAAVDEVAARQMTQGNTVSLASPIVIDLAEKLVDMVQGVDWALFGKNGADSTALAVMVARRATGRRRVVKIDGGYHGSAAWMQREGAPGTIAEDQEPIHVIGWNDPSALQAVIDAHPDDVACFISSPYHHPVLADNELPAADYWAQIETICRANGVVLIVDDVRAGFRIDLAGSHVAYGFQPDMICFGKALGNGHPVAALTGTEALREAAGEVFYTGTQFFNAAPMAAALETLKQLEATDAATVVTAIGERLNAGLVDVAATHGHELVTSGVAAMPYLRLNVEGGFREHHAWIAEVVRRGAYFLSYHNNFVSTAHTDADIERTLEIADAAFGAVASAT